MLENTSKANKRRGEWKILENLIAGRWDGGNFIWYVKIEYKEAEVLWVTNDWQST